MRHLLLVSLALLTLALRGGSAAAQPPDAERAKRAAALEKQIAELEEKVSRLRAELAELRPAPRPMPEPPRRGDLDVGGTIKELLQNNGETVGFSLPDVVIYFRKDAEFLFSDTQKAGPADLKTGQSVTARIDRAALSQKRDPPLAFAYTVIIHKPKGGKR
jgi:sugar-specific transcriptional regulator TrmB